VTETIRAAFPVAAIAAIADRAPEWIMWMPAGRHTVHGTRDGQPIEVSVVVDSAAARAVQTDLARFSAESRHRPYIDFAHNRQAAAGWPTEVAWRAGDGDAGVWLRVNWSEEGAKSITGRTYRAFSPEFMLEGERVTGTLLDMGGLCNNPGFSEIKPIWAARPADAASGSQPVTATNQTNMDPTIVTLPAATPAPAAPAATPAPNPQLVPAAAPPAAPVLAVAPPAAPDLASDLSTVRAELTRLAGELTAVRQQAALSPRLTPVIHGQCDMADALRGYQAANARDRGLIYAREIKPVFNEKGEFPVSAANALGTLVGNIITQRALDLVQEEYLWLRSITTDFSAESVAYGQGVLTRILTPPTVTDYSTSTGYATSDITATDKTVTINAHKAVQVALTANDMSGTKRSLIEEEAEAMQYSIGKSLADAVGALFTAAVYTNETVCLLANFTRAIAINMITELNKRKTPRFRRSLVLNADFYGALLKDAGIISLALAESWGAAGTGRVPNVAGAAAFEWADLPALGGDNNQGFVCSPDAAVLAVRLPNDYTLAAAGVPQTAVIETVTNPHTGLSVLLTKFCDHKLGVSYGRAAWMFGVAAAQITSMQRVVTS
jgi:hypothetical protein